MDWGALAAGAGAIISSGIGAVTSGNMNRKNREFQSEMLGKQQDFAREQREWQLETEKGLTADERAYNEEMYNKYQSPEAYVRQLREAGLNPSLAYGGNSAGSPEIADYSNIQAGASPSASPLPQFDMSHHFSDISKNLVALSSQAIQSRLADNDAARVEFQRQVASAQTLKYLSERNLIDNETYGKELDNLFKESTLGKRIEQVNVSVDEATQRIAESKQLIQESLSRINVNEKQASKINADIELINQNIKNAKLAAEQIKAETFKTWQSGKTEVFKRENISADTALKEVSVLLNNSRKLLTDVEIELKRLDIPKAEVDAFLAPLRSASEIVGNVFKFVAK